MSDIIFYHPEPAPRTRHIRPVFIPFAGCPGRCVFCAQTAQTGVGPAALSERYSQLQKELQLAYEAGESPFELAYYGGTFTALDDMWQEKFIALGRQYRHKGLVTSIRCSTRPDCVDVAGLQRLHRMGLDTVELGIQSFSNDALTRSGRGYTAHTAVTGCRIVREAGLGLGIQLMPGLPGHSEGAFLRDVRTACSLGPDMVRLYPCLVFEGTLLASWWRNGRYRPWGVARASVMLGMALNTFWKHGIRVIRAGVAHVPSLAGKVLAGAYHPALGSMARGEALAGLVSFHTLMLGGKATELYAPRRFQGEFWGHRNTLVPRWARHGLGRSNVHWWDKSFFLLS
ncbi:elongator complex protein 3 [Oleidesulfovibrio alaskensis]